MDPDKVVQVVKDSELRGRGGAGFPCGMKWGFLPKDVSGPRYVVVLGSDRNLLSATTGD